MPGSSALIVIDMLNPYQHDDADELAANIAEVIEPLSELIALGARIRRRAHLRQRQLRRLRGERRATRRAYVRHYSVCVPRDAVAPIDHRLGDAALRMMERNMRADITTTANVMRSRRFVTS